MDWKDPTTWGWFGAALVGFLVTARLIHYDDWRGALVRRVAVYVNFFDHNHIG